MTHNQLKKLAEEHGLDIQYVSAWTPPKDGEDLRALIAMPNIPKPLHGVAPRTVLGSTTWNYMRKACYHAAHDTCEICGERPDNLRHRHGHEVYEINYKEGTAKFVRVFCVCATCHLACIHTGRAITLFKQGNPLYPKEFLLEGAEKAFTLISSLNKGRDEAPVRAYATFIEYLKCDELRESMLDLIKKYEISFYSEDPKAMAKWGDWNLVIGNKHYPTPYKSEKEWREAMEEQGKKDTDRIMQKSMDKIFSGDIYKELDEILKGGKDESTTSSDRGTVNTI